MRNTELLTKAERQAVDRHFDKLRQAPFYAENLQTSVVMDTTEATLKLRPVAIADTKQVLVLRNGRLYMVSHKLGDQTVELNRMDKTGLYTVKDKVGHDGDATLHVVRVRTLRDSFMAWLRGFMPRQWA